MKAVAVQLIADLGQEIENRFLDFPVLVALRLVPLVLLRWVFCQLYVAETLIDLRVLAELLFDWRVLNLEARKALGQISLHRLFAGLPELFTGALA